MNEYKLRFLKSEDGKRIALADISTEQEMIKNLIINSIMIGAAALTAFFLVSLFLSHWAVRPVEAAWERQRQFVSDASHELKTPLTVILSNAEMLCFRRTFLEKKEARRIEHIQAEAIRMKKLVEDLLLLAESDSVERTKIQENVDLSYLVTNAVLTFEPIAFDDGKKIIYDLQNKISIIGDAQRLQQLVSILLDNAVKYCSPGGKIHVSLKENSKKNAVLVVTNDGEPISEEEGNQIFQRFYRIDKSRSAHDSFGLGLSIAESISREHGGKIWMESNACGNSFFVALPLYRI